MTGQLLSSSFIILWILGPNFNSKGPNFEAKVNKNWNFHYNKPHAGILGGVAAMSKIDAMVMQLDKSCYFDE